jgi:hypothetical protein
VPSLAEQAEIIERAIVIATRAGLATPGPWGCIRPSGAIVASGHGEIAECTYDPDALFIAHGRGDIPWLLHHLLTELYALVALHERVAVLEAAIGCVNAALNQLPWQGDGLRHLAAEGAATVEVVAAIHAAAGALDPEILGLKGGQA